MSSYRCRFVFSNDQQSLEIEADDLATLLFEMIRVVWPLPDPDPRWDNTPSLIVTVDVSGGYMLALNADELSRLALDVAAYRNDPTEERLEALQQTLRYLVTERFSLSQDLHDDVTRFVVQRLYDDPSRVRKPPVA